MPLALYAKGQPYGQVSYPSGYEVCHWMVDGTRIEGDEAQEQFGRNRIEVPTVANTTVNVSVAFRLLNTTRDNIQITEVQARFQNWVRITNTSTEVALSTRGLFLTDANVSCNDVSTADGGRLLRWQLPAMIIPPERSVLIPMRAGNYRGDEPFHKRTQYVNNISFGERLRITCGVTEEIIQTVEVTLMRDDQMQRRAPDGVWNLTYTNMGVSIPPCEGGCNTCGCATCFPEPVPPSTAEHGCGRCGCTRCFVGGRCNVPTCARCFCQVCGTHPCSCNPVRMEITNVTPNTGWTNGGQFSLQLDVTVTNISSETVPEGWSVTLEVPAGTRVNQLGHPVNNTNTRIDGTTLTITGRTSGHNGYTLTPGGTMSFYVRLWVNENFL